MSSALSCFISAAVTTMLLSQYASLIFKELPNAILNKIQLLAQTHTKEILRTTFHSIELFQNVSISNTAAFDWDLQTLPRSK